MLTRLIFCLFLKCVLSALMPEFVTFNVCLFEVLQPSQPNGFMSSVVNLPNHTFTGQA